MAIVYQITEPEMNGLFDRLELIEKRQHDDVKLSPDERNRLATVHRTFHMAVVQWAQEMGFRGFRS